jgi:hypothetical protein
MNIRKGFLKFTLVLSILVGVITPICHERFFDKNEIDVTLPENWNRMSTQEKLDGLGGLLSKGTPFFLLSEIKQLNIRRHLKKMIVDKEDEVLRGGFNYSFGFRFFSWMGRIKSLGLGRICIRLDALCGCKNDHSLDSIRANDTFPLTPFAWANRISRFPYGGV